MHEVAHMCFFDIRYNNSDFRNIIYAEKYDNIYIVLNSISTAIDHFMTRDLIIEREKYIYYYAVRIISTVIQEALLEKFVNINFILKIFETPLRHNVNYELNDAEIKVYCVHANFSDTISIRS